MSLLNINDLHASVEENEILNTKVLYTIVDGEIVYEN